MLFERNLPINEFDDFSQTAYAENNTPNATENCVKRNLIGNRKCLKNIIS